ncbi:hypothetical protein VNO77_15317 [Canavalia gladiata]|uniref:EF-hand domain-containing protein n=1 Tax=Canavalia gladiata TaxID=3824 RepID=A0AAN9M481_CANGL
MKFPKLNPKRLFRFKDRSAISRSDPPSFGSGTSSSAAANGGRTPTSVLPAVSGDWADAVTGDFHFELAQAFRLIDRDNDGIVSVAEFETVLARLSRAAPSESVISAVFGAGDCISVDELANRVGSGFGAGSNSEELREAFELFDEDGDGRISAKELLRVFAAIGDEDCTLEECRRMIDRVDRKGNGFVCFEDFSRMMDLQTWGECC